MSFISRWMESIMEDPEKVIERAHEVKEKSGNLAAIARNRFDQPHYYPKAWKNPWHRAGLRRGLFFGGSDGKQSRYLSSSTTRANSYDTVLEFYDRKKTELDAK